MQPQCKDKTKASTRTLLEYITTIIFYTEQATFVIRSGLHLTEQCICTFYCTHQMSDLILLMLAILCSGCYDTLWMLILSLRLSYINLFSTERHSGHWVFDPVMLLHIIKGLVHSGYQGAALVHRHLPVEYNPQLILSTHIWKNHPIAKCLFSVDVISKVSVGACRLELMLS